MVRNRLGIGDEVILSVLASPDVVAGIAWQGMEPVFADLDAESMSLTEATVVEQLTVHTKAVLVTPTFGVVGNWEALRSITEPRGISLQVEGEGGNEKWQRIAPGIKGMGERLIYVDPQLICEGARGFQHELAAFGIEAQLMPEWRGRRRDFPGMAAIEDCVLLVEEWRQKVEDLTDCARLTARQTQFVFEEKRRLPVAAAAGELRVRRVG